MGSNTPGGGGRATITIAEDEDRDRGGHQEPISPLSFSYSNFKKAQNPSRITLLQRAFSVRVLLIGSFAFMILFMAGVMYGITSYSQNKITDDLSNRILYNVVKRAMDIAKSSFSYPYIVVKSMVHYIPARDNVTMEEVREILWPQWLSSGGLLDNIIWTNIKGDTIGYVSSISQEKPYVIYCNSTNGPDQYLVEVTDYVNGIGNASNGQITLKNFSLKNFPWYDDVISSRNSEPIWTPIFDNTKFDTIFISAYIPIVDPETNETVSIIGVDVTSEQLRESFMTIDISKHAEVWLMEQDGDMIVSTSQTDSTGGITNALHSSSELIRLATQIFFEDEPHSETDNSFSFHLHGKKIRAHFHPMRDYGLDLHLLLAFPENDFFGVVRSVERTILGVSAGAFVLACGIGFVVMYFITVPLTRLGKQMEEISKGSFEMRLDKQNSTKLLEINNLQEDFYRMVNAIRSFGRFVPVDIVRYLLRANMEAGVFMHQKELTVMFSDIKNFTRKVEEMSPAQLSLILSDYLDAMCAAIADTGGTVDKFIGDAIMALWNVPTHVSWHEMKACSAALDSLRALTDLNRKWNTIGLPTVECRIGIHTGRALVGNLGSQERLSFTAVGDNINLAARLESLNKKYGTSILISGELYEKVKNQFLCRYLDVVVVVGRTTHTHIYELVGTQMASTHSQRTLCASQAEAVKLFLERDFDSSIEILENLSLELPDGILVSHPSISLTSLTSLYLFPL